MTPHATPFPGVDCVYVINLESRADRRLEMSAQLAGIGASFSAAPVRLFTAVRPDGPGAFPSAGARGCFLSHLAVLKDAAAAGHRCIVILEDDLNFADDFSRFGPAVIGRAARDDRCSMFYGGYVVSAAAPLPSPLAVISPETEVQTTHFVGIKQPTIDAAIGYLEAMLARPPGDPQGGPMHVDGAYSWFRRAHPAFTTLLCAPQLGYQRASRTDIHALAWYDKLPIVRQWVERVRRGRNR